ncbi:PHP domain-containing protein [Haloferula sp. A504]|uniref:PHP domain-containing protein n=1 Tax=Haloferula sp. A504 TaxID=3373601 RepID=UPI0031C7E8E9|nr:hypothetical protein [Verrucomicrobiaceae bacterium E54]
MNRRFLLLLSIGLPAIAFGPAAGAAPRLSLNPYDGVDWRHVGRHFGSFHSHTTESDGKLSPAAVIDRHHAIGHDVLALTDHNRNTWPWSRFDRDPERLGMLAIPGNELSRHDHTLSLFTDLETDTKDHETGIREIQEAGGLSVLAHPGRYWKPEGGKVPADVLDRYARLFRTYPSLVALEVINQADRYPRDRALWDALLTELMPSRPVWGMANDDSHQQAHIGLNTTVLLLPQRDEAQVRAALTDGRFYFTTLTSHPEARRDRDRTPVIREIAHDRSAGTLMLEVDCGGEPLPADRIRWISSGGEEVHRGPVLDLALEGIDKYVRAEIAGSGGTTYTQPFGIGAENPSHPRNTAAPTPGRSPRR